MAEAKTARVAEVVRAAARALEGAAGDYDPLLEQVGAARFVLLGEASHGTHEFYSERAEVTKRLIAERGFTAVAVEPLEHTPRWETGEPPETYPSGI